MSNMLLFTIVVITYLFIVGYLGYYGYKKTKSTLDYLVAGRSAHPVIMAISYGATFISTSAIVGFGGVAASMGMGLLWLTFLNIFVGIFIAFVFFGKRIRHMGHNLDVHTFPELLSKRFQSSFIQLFGGLIICFFMPLYSAAVLIGASRFLETTFAMDYNVALLIYSLIICAYVMAGGLKGVMYTDAFQGAIMLVGMIFFIAFTYTKLGGITQAHQALTMMVNQIPDKLAAQGHMGWTSMPKLGSALWWSLVSTIVLGVGIGVLAQPQLVVRFMTVKSSKEINRAVPIGGIFILFMTGVAFTVGALSNIYFFNNPQFGKIAVEVAEGNVDKIIPMYVNSAMPTWFVYIFMLTLLAAAMSTTSSQFHSVGTSVGRDIYEKWIMKGKQPKNTLLITRLGVVLGVIAAIILGYKLPGGIIAVATAIFMGLCASVFLPTLIGAIYWKGMTKAGAIASMLTGFFGTIFWLIFIYKKSSEAFGFCQFIFNKPSLGVFPWVVVDQIIVILPLSAIVAIAVSIFTKKLNKEHLDVCFKHIK